ncbi:maleylacetate reductase [Actinomycetospora chlora]|uniref:Maleylacetate reductase n=1 Tax=Actinomycetospora chlora TaxID=663608 RepID=A0ABP9BZI7_9PSEU
MTAVSLSFVHDALPMRVVFGAGRRAELGAEVDRLGLRRVLVLGTPEQEAALQATADGLGGLAAGVFPQARQHVPAAIAAAAADRARELGADGCVALGGGSSVGLGKAVALRHGLPVIAVPTTYAGSEMTPIWGLTEDGEKRTGRDRAVLPRTVVYDPELTRTLPVGLSVTSGLNAVAHAVEGLWAPDGTPITALMAEEGVRSLLAALPTIVERPDDLDARAGALQGAWLCGAVLGATTMSLHHKLCHVLGGSFDLPHAETHAVVLPHVVAYNGPSAPAAVAALGRALGVAADPETVAKALAGRARELGAPTSLAAIGMPRDGLPSVVDRVLAQPYANPAPVTREGLTALLEAAY